MRRNVVAKRGFLFTSLLLGLLLSLSSIVASQETAKYEIEQALSLTPNPENGKKVFETCKLCHTAEGWGSAQGRFPQISGQHASVIIKQLADIRAGNRDNPTMFPFTGPRILKDSQTIADVAAYISKLPMTPENGKGLGNSIELAHGEKLYKKNCTNCHGENGEGDASNFYPRIQGQHFQYLFRQMRWIKLGKRRNANKKMVKQIHDFSLRDLQAVSDYVSRIKPASELLAEPDWKNPDFKKNLISAPKVQINMNQK